MELQQGIALHERRTSNFTAQETGGGRIYKEQSTSAAFRARPESQTHHGLAEPSFLGDLSLMGRA